MYSTICVRFGGLRCSTDYAGRLWDGSLSLSDDVTEGSPEAFRPTVLYRSDESLRVASVCVVSRNGGRFASRQTVLRGEKYGDRRCRYR